MLPGLDWEAKSEIRENILVFAPELINSSDFLSGENTRGIFCSEILGWLPYAFWRGAGHQKDQTMIRSLGFFSSTLHSPEGERG